MTGGWKRLLVLERSHRAVEPNAVVRSIARVVVCVAAAGWIGVALVLVTKHSARAQTESSDPAERRIVSVRLRPEQLTAPEARALGALLSAELASGDWLLQIEHHSEPDSVWFRKPRPERRALLLASLDAPPGQPWRLVLVDPVREKAAVRELAGDNAASLEAIASIVVSAAAALEEGEEVGSRSVDELMPPTPPPSSASPRENDRSSPAPSEARAPGSLPKELAVGVGPVLASFTDAEPTTLGFRAAARWGHPGRWAVALGGARFEEAGIDDALGEFGVIRSQLWLAGGPQLRFEPFELESDLLFGIEGLQRRAVNAVVGAASTQDALISRGFLGLGLGVRFRVSRLLNLEAGGSARYFLREVRFTGSASAARTSGDPSLGSRVLEQPWSVSVDGHLGVEFIVP